MKSPNLLWEDQIIQPENIVTNPLWIQTDFLTEVVRNQEQVWIWLPVLTGSLFSWDVISGQTVCLLLVIGNHYVLNFLGPSHYDRSETTKKFDADDEDLDAMINSLKQKTSGRQGKW